MDAIVTVMFMLLANGDVKTVEFPSFEGCRRAQQVLVLDAQVRGDTRFSRILCIEQTAPVVAGVVR